MPRRPASPPPAPKRVRIGHRFYAVVFLPSITSEGVACDGLCVWQPAQLLLGDYLDGQALAETFIHECLHACHAEAGLTDASTEEDFTTFDAKALCRLEQDNPSAMRWYRWLLKQLPALPDPSSVPQAQAPT